MTSSARCVSCHQQLEAGARFCGNCGTAVPTEPVAPPAQTTTGVECPSCHHENPFSASFCERCGTQISGAAPDRGASASRSAGSYRPGAPVTTEPGDPWATGPGFDRPLSRDAACPRCGTFRNPGESACVSCGLPFDQATNNNGVPAAVALQGDPAGFWIRFLAVIIDGLIVFGIGAILWPLLFGETFWVTETFESANGTITSITTTQNWHWLMQLLYSIIFLTLFSTTPGKRLFNIYIYDVNGSRKLSVLRVTVRQLATNLSAIILLIGYLMAAFRKDKRALHDLIAGTYPTVR